MLIAEFQDPVMAGEFVELVGNKGATEFKQSGPTGVNVGVTSGTIFILSCLGTPGHVPFVSITCKT